MRSIIAAKAESYNQEIMSRWMANHADDKQIKDITDVILRTTKPKSMDTKGAESLKKIDENQSEVDGNWARMKTFFGAHK